MSNRITGPNSSDPSEKTQPITQAEQDRGKRVGKVEKIDPDEQARNRRKEAFRAMMEEDDEPKGAPSDKPISPIDLFSSDSRKKSLGSVEESALPSPKTSPPPTVKPTGHATGSEIKEDLPHSKEFWHQVNLPDEPPPSKPSISSVEKDSLHPTSPSAKKEKREERTLEIPSTEDSPNHSKSFSKRAEKKEEIPPLSKKEEEKSPRSGHLLQKDEEQKKAPTARYWEPEQKIERAATPFTSKKENDEESGKLGKKPGSKNSLQDKEEDLEPSTDPRSSPNRPFTELDEQPKAWKNRPKDKLDKSEKPLPAVPQLTPDTQQAAVQAALQAQPYLNPEVLPLFLQLIGSILVMVSRSGTSKTEVHLVGAAFEKSKFYGSTIEITKFSTAPDSINIRLTGTNEAVTAFNQNLSQLRAAFDTGNFKFRVGRLAAEYSPTQFSSKRKKRNKDDEMSEGES